MEKNILKTLIYFDIFDYPLRVWEIQKWLVGKKIDLTQVKLLITRLIKKKKIEENNDFFTLKGRSGLVNKRMKNQISSKNYFNQAKLASNFFKLIPWIKLVGISGNLAMDDASEKDDIDFFIVTKKGRMWITRIILLAGLIFTGKLRKKSDLPKNAAGKFCVNLILEEDKLQQEKHNLYIAHEVLQMKVLWERNSLYQKYLEDNSWAFELLPNWISPVIHPGRIHKESIKQILELEPFPFGDILEHLAKKIQVWYMGKPTGQEIITNGALYFHPQNYREKVLDAYRQKISSLRETKSRLNRGRSMESA